MYTPVSFTFRRLVYPWGSVLSLAKVHMPFNRELRVGSAPPYHHNANSGKGNLVFEIRGLTYLELNSF